MTVQRLLGPAVALLLLAAALAEIVATTGWHGPRPLAILAASVIALPFASLPRRPLLVVLISCSGLAAEALAVGTPASTAALAAVLLSGFVAGLAVSRGRWVSFAVVLATALIAIVRVPGNGGPPSPLAFAFAVALYVSPFGLGALVRSRSRAARVARADADRAEEQQRLLTQLAVRDERDRIAEELRVVVTAAVDEILRESEGGAQLVRADPAGASRSFESVERAGQGALADMRRLLGVLREVDDSGPLLPQPRLAALDALIESFAATGTAASVEVSGTARSLPDAVELSAYRIVEGALRLCSTGSAVVQVDYLDDVLGLRVSGGEGRTDPVVVTGMSERAALCGGTLSLEVVAGRTLDIRAMLPTGAA